MKHPIHFVGAGPGDPELITVRGKRLVQEAGRIVYAGSLVPVALLDDAAAAAERFDSAGLTLAQTHDLLVDGYHRGQRVVRLHTGDPSLYGATQEQMLLLDREGIPYGIVPGVSAVFAAAAELKQELTLPEVSQTLIVTRMGGRTPVPEAERLSSLAGHGATLAIYLSIHKVEEVVAELLAGYPAETPVVVAYRVGWPEQQFIDGSLADIAARVKASGIERQALILVGKVLAARSGGASPPSRLYDPSFAHGFRHARQSATGGGAGAPGTEEDAEG
jgi:precorrin-4/cobalt-precorrin-4 C11-methyltransferase